MKVLIMTNQANQVLSRTYGAAFSTTLCKRERTIKLDKADSVNSVSRYVRHSMS